MCLRVFLFHVLNSELLYYDALSSSIYLSMMRYVTVLVTDQSRLVKPR